MSAPPPPDGSLRGRALLGSAWSLSSQAAGLLLQIATTAVLARLLTPAEFGLVAMVMPFVGLLTLMQETGLPAVTVQRQDLTGDEIASLFWLNMALSAGLALCLTALAPLLAWFFGRPELVPMTLALAALMLPAALVLQHRALLQRSLRFGVLAGINIAIQAAASVVAVAAAWMGMGPWALIIHGAALTLLQIPLYWAAHPFRPGWRPRLAEGRHLARAGWEISGSQALQFVARSLDKILIGRLWGDAALGLYSRAFNLVLTPVGQIATPVGQVALPLLSRLTAEPSRYRRAFRQILEKVMLAVMPGIVVLVVEARPVVLVLLGPNWLEAVPILQAFAVAALVLPLNTASRWLFISQGRSAAMLRWSAASTAVQLAAVAAGLPWGAFGVAVALAVANVAVMTPMCWWIARGPLFGLRDTAGAMAPFLLGSLVSGATLLAGEPLLADRHPAVAVAAALAWAYAVQVTTLFALPPYRRIVLDLGALALDALRVARNSG